MSTSTLERGQPSRMAQRTAMMRAVHQLYDDEPRVLDDPLAVRIIGTEAREWLTQNLAQYRTLPLLRARSINVVRARYAEDWLERAMARGVRQFVILGAGLDTFAYRSRWLPPELMIFEVDHPVTQAWKRQRLEEAEIDPPPNVRFAPVDFTTGTLGAGLGAAGFCADRPAFFSWLGVTYYLPPAAVEATLRHIAGLAPGSQVVFDFALTDEALPAGHKALFHQLLEFAAAEGEPWLARYAPAALMDLLRKSGFEEIEHVDHAQATDRYLAGRRDGLAVNYPVQLMSAWTRPRLPR